MRERERARLSFYREAERPNRQSHILTPSESTDRISGPNLPIKMQSKYPALLALSNVILLVSSTILVYLGSALVTFYLLDRLDFVSVYFAVVPRIMVAIGVATFAVALYGCYGAATSSR